MIEKGYVMTMEVLQDKLQITNARQELIRRGVAIITGVDLSLEVFRRTLYQPYRAQQQHAGVGKTKTLADKNPR